MKPIDIVIGITSYNEVCTISDVTLQIDRGLQRFFPQLNAVILNLDNCSMDGTREAFLATRTRTRKLYLPTSPGRVGKGENLRNLLDFASAVNSEATATFDGDLRSMSPTWVKSLLSPVLDHGLDFAYPAYDRHRFDGTTTNLICYPIMVGAFCADIRQPIGGDFAFSHRCVNELRASQWPASAHGFGVDILMTTEVVMRGLNICGVQLGQKIHRRRERSTKGPMTRAVLDTLLFQMRKYRLQIEPLRAIESPPIFVSRCPHKACPSVPVDYNAIKQHCLDGCAEHLEVYQRALPSSVYLDLKRALEIQKVPDITSEIWTDILCDLIECHLSSKEDVTAVPDSIVPLFFGRMLSFAKAAAKLSDEDVEGYIKRQGALFYRKRLRMFRG
jgi:hypothetical protein